MTRPPRYPAQRSAQFWRAASVTAACAAIVILAIGGNAAFIAAGALVAATAGVTGAEARFRSRNARPSDLADVLAPALALAATLTFLLGLAAHSRLP
jgi:uncharacterized membrane protein YphA (DoxX/SURF4 family)